MPYFGSKVLLNLYSIQFPNLCKSCRYFVFRHPTTLIQEGGKGHTITKLF